MNQSRFCTFSIYEQVKPHDVVNVPASRFHKANLCGTATLISHMIIDVAIGHDTLSRVGRNFKPDQFWAKKSKP
ncbi:hypothetical protein VNO77_03873 [Canavalia gladiata]|uniref:Uncharacterized protein n=1 Tax=Canavalia gladiata TaxID=3824 RepID=A0AAN9R8J4_CANGL